MAADQETTFYFDVVSHDVAILDEEGSVLPSLSAAREEAVLIVRELVGEELRHGGKLDEARWIKIRDAQGVILAAIPFSAALRGLE